MLRQGANFILLYQKHNQIRDNSGGLMFVIPTAYSASYMPFSGTR